MKKVLSIAGSDSGGGAGIQADLKTFAALGCYGTTAVTALTSQNTMGVQGVFPVTPAFVAQQIDSVLSDIGADVIKIGMLLNAPIIEAVARSLKRFAHIPIILDPVMISTSGHALLEDDAVEALKRDLFPMAALVTPNFDEAIFLVGTCEAKAAAQKILAMGPQAVLIKGGHRSLPSCEHAEDYLLDAGQSTTFSAPWVKTKNTHGTGCTLAAAIACYMALDFSLSDSVKMAKAYLSGALQAGSEMNIGQGFGPVRHDWRAIPCA
ncbi:MAG: bifunctional hydroxymethylpyrimidine kinase/phosphomethylpyrimidine kinase [Myxococcota bacterium]